VWFFGDFEVNSAFLESIINDSSEDSANFEVGNPGLKGQFHISWCVDKYRMPSFGVAVMGSKGTMKVDDYSLNLTFNDGGAFSWFRHDLDDSVNFLLGESEYYREDAEFVKSVVANRRTEPSFETASRTDYIIDQVKKEAEAN
jgi:predicted dehydrogenase